jgi:ribosomal-protein-alanine N-acetyltransferase
MRFVTLLDAGYDALATLHAGAFDRPWSAEQIEALAVSPGALGMAAMNGKALLGFVLLRVVAGEAEVLTIAVDRAHRRQGVGRALMNAVAGTAASFGAEEVFLEVAEDNPAAIRLYEAVGYEPVGRRKAYYERRGGAVDAILLRARLNTAPSVG